MKIKSILKLIPLPILKRIANYRGFYLDPKGLGYFNPEIVVLAAKSKELTLCQYLENFNIGGVGKRRDLIISSIVKNLPLNFEIILEIGAGTGMYLEKIIEHYQPKQIEIYETNQAWNEYLKSEYSSKTKLICHNASGRNLKDTNSNSIDIAFSHAVFVYLPIITTYQYLEEMARVVKPEGYLVFDCFTSSNFNIATITDWMKENIRFPVIIPDAILYEYFKKFNLELKVTFDSNYHESYTTYFILQKKQ